MAPKQKASDAGSSTSTGAKSSNNNPHDRQGNSERGHGGHSNGNAVLERAGSGVGNDRSSSGTGHGEKGSSLTVSSGTAKRKAEAPLITVDFADMDISALRRYCRLNKLKPKSKARDDLVTAATKHWNSVNAKELDSVAYFLFAVKHRHNVLKLTMPLP
ncbi:hypothetical protein BC939DRAFT_434283 [Gamsiella multidivaricata]|uniref:uncharacterized protein n=1 Tax=Gamsiella multidivaricata TaxID=101098 RepID=UPI00221EF800|nr:uncharacterized protein BC939DRAFT_434283 [Gamsiella multidivaricata]KAI7832753.1 hypothetical protein BC939DRAFT_434283 [Gamsiella multidivaricata]